MDISDTQLHALKNLRDKQQGKDVAYINIACARGLTDLGLAERGAAGWEITPAGLAFLAVERG